MLLRHRRFRICSDSQRPPLLTAHQSQRMLHRRPTRSTCGYGMPPITTTLPSFVAVVAAARRFSPWPPPTLVALSTKADFVMTTAAVLYCYRRSSSSTATAALRRGHRRRYHDYCRFALFIAAAHYKPRGGPLNTSWRLRRPSRRLLSSGPSPFSFVAATAAFHHAPRQQPPRPTMKSPNKG